MTQESKAPSLYVGESRRSVQERGKEHYDAARRGDQGSYMVRHRVMEHGGQASRFVLKVGSYHSTALSRQVKEAVRIRRREGAGHILNSKAEFNRCHIPCLIIEEEDHEVTNEREKLGKEEEDEVRKILDEENTSWKQKRQEKWR